MKKSQYYDWKDLDLDVKSLVYKISLSGWLPELIVCTTKGGVIPSVMISYHINVPIVILQSQAEESCESCTLELNYNKLLGKRVLVVDNICDEDESLMKFSSELIKRDINFKTCTLFFNIRQKFFVDYAARKIDRFKEKFWIVFPWEI